MTTEPDITLSLLQQNNRLLELQGQMMERINKLELAQASQAPQQQQPAPPAPPAPSVPATGTAPPAPATPAEEKQNYNVIVQRTANKPRTTPESKAALNNDWEAIINPLRQADNKRRYG